MASISIRKYQQNIQFELMVALCMLAQNILIIFCLAWIAVSVHWIIYFRFIYSVFAQLTWRPTLSFDPNHRPWNEERKKESQLLVKWQIDIKWKSNKIPNANKWRMRKKQTIQLRSMKWQKTNCLDKLDTNK